MTAFMRLCILLATITIMLMIVIVGSLSAPTAADAQVQASNPPVETSTRVVQAATRPKADSRATANSTGLPDVVMGRPLPATMEPPTPTPLPTTRRAIVGRPGTTDVASANAGTKLDRWTVGKYETLSEISLKALGSARRWNEIALLNPSVDPERLQVGTVLKLPSTSPTGASLKVTQQQPEPVHGQRTYVVQHGDSLSLIAARLLGSANDWRQIFEANRGVLKNDPDRLPDGLTLVIPSR